MRGYLILSLIGLSVAAPQYNYNQPQSSSGHFHQQQHHQQSPAIWNKHFSIYSAPEDNGLDGNGGSSDQSAARRNLRVVIIRAPENKGLTDAALQLAKSSTSDKTAVYVLTKQTDLGELQNKLAQSHDANANKPEVHFVKYRTPEEAEHAQHSIQAQYNNLNGPTQISNEGVAPVQSFVGSVPHASNNGGNFGGSNFGGNSYGAATAPQPTVHNTYLPAALPAPAPAPIQNSYVPPPVANNPVVHNTYLPAAPPAPAPIQNTYVPPPVANNPVVHNTYLPAAPPAPAPIQNTYVPPPVANNPIVHNTYLPSFH